MKKAVIAIIFVSILLWLTTSKKEDYKELNESVNANINGILTKQKSATENITLSENGDTDVEYVGEQLYSVK